MPTVTYNFQYNTIIRGSGWDSTHEFTPDAAHGVAGIIPDASRFVLKSADKETTLLTITQADGLTVSINAVTGVISTGIRLTAAQTSALAAGDTHWHLEHEWTDEAVSLIPMRGILPVEDC